MGHTNRVQSITTCHSWPITMCHSWPANQLTGQQEEELDEQQYHVRELHSPPHALGHEHDSHSSVATKVALREREEGGRRETTGAQEEGIPERMKEFRK